MDETLHPELVFGLVGPIGVDMGMVEGKLKAALVAVGYRPQMIRVTELMRQIDVRVSIADSIDPLKHYESRIDYANAVRSRCQNDAALAALAIHRIRHIRESVRQAANQIENPTQPFADRPLAKHAYIIRQFKRREEIDLLRKVYGRKFIQISANVSAEERVRSLARRVSTQNANLDPKACENYAKALVERDLEEIAVDHGQRVGDVFHLGDVFVDARSEATTESTVRRFIEAFFGKNAYSPTPDEYATYMAASAGLRSLDTSRQVGAAIFTADREIIALGCNEVPKAGGGTYWEGDPEKHRDFDEGHDANTTSKRRVLFDTLSRLKTGGFISSEETDIELFERVSKSDALADAMLLDITEFGRMAHAEMNALTDAARLGRSTRGATLYCTTFPCHNCAKHIVASGIRRVVYIEPYPKSKALDLHYDSISLNKVDGNKSIFEHFNGISPRRYRDIFEKQKRRNSDGTLKEWCDGEPAPRIEDRGPFHVFSEPQAILHGLGEVARELGATE
jgi:deoxycytidylate deaminase